MNKKNQKNSTSQSGALSFRRGAQRYAGVQKLLLKVGDQDVRMLLDHERRNAGNGSPARNSGSLTALAK